MEDWFYIENIDETDSPALVVYAERVNQNIAAAIKMIGDVSRLRPHVKTNKMTEVSTMMLAAGITKFKCATIAEAEMLGMIKAPDVLLAYQPVGPKIKRFINLVKTYPQTIFSCLLDDEETAMQLAAAGAKEGIVIPVFIDINNGMNRTGMPPDQVISFIRKIKAMPSLHIVGLQVYDGHIRDSDFILRKQKSDNAFSIIETLQQQASSIFSYPLKVVAGGTPTFPVHVQRNSYVECSPGTFVFWDWGYQHTLPDEPFEYAALVISRIVSVLDEETICVDLGHKSIAAENPLPRVHFLNAPEAVPLSQSEEHLVLKIPVNNHCKVGDVLYGVPVHICPTVALYNKAYVARDNRIVDSWEIIARNRSITL